MTRDATPENVKGDFGGVTYDYQGIKTRLERVGDEFFIETVDPDWAADHARGGAAPPRTIKVHIDRTVGSHWIQEYFHKAPNGRLQRLPVLYHIVEKRWVQSNGAFLSPDTDDFWAQCRGLPWNDTCLYCHNTEPIKNPQRNSAGRTIGYDTQVTELGIACAACHGPGVEHVRAQRSNLATSESDVVHPARLPVDRRDEICGRCHGALVPKASMWDPVTHRDPFIPGQELTLFNNIFWSEAQQAELAGLPRPHDQPAPVDGRFWGDGTPLTTALEYNGMALSACYQGAKGKLSCLSCHTMHGDEPNFLLKPKMTTNDACYQCHGDYRAKLAEHTHHGTESAGSLCYNCHMPKVVYSLLNTHRSHRIQVPDLASSVGTGKPHACNLCHLDRSLGWTRDELAKWPNGKKNATAKLSADEEQFSATVLGLATSDARTRVMIAGAFSDPGARRAAGDDWFGSFLTRLLRGERYPAVRYLEHRGLRAAYGEKVAGTFDYLAKPRDRETQLNILQSQFDSKPIKRALPHLSLTPDGLPDDAVLNRLRKNRSDPDLRINE
jgi:predicted CXXCH cytochrome family protein